MALDGAVYSPPEEIVPKVELPPLMPPTSQLTFVLEAPVTVAMNCCVCPKSKFTLAGETDTVTPEFSVTGTLAMEVLLACAMQVTVTVVGVTN